MGIPQPKVACVVLPFAPKPRAAAYLTSFDRMEINRWRDLARMSGYDRMVIHEREAGDFAEVGNFLSVYREGEAWSRWVFARLGGAVSAWCGVTGADVGEFPTLAAAFAAVMPAPVQISPTAAERSSGNVVFELVPRLRRAAGA